MKEGFYAVTFGTPAGTGTGVVFLENGLIRGGDSIIYYLGNYTLDGEKFSAEVTTNRHATMPGMQSVFGRDNVHISLKGSFSGQDARLTGTAKEVPGVSFSASLKRIGS